MEPSALEAIDGSDAHSNNHLTLKPAATSTADSTDQAIVTDIHAQDEDNSESVTSEDNDTVVASTDTAIEDNPPPFWNKHGRSASSVSYQSISHLRPPNITLEDHSDEDDESGRACWAKHAAVDSWVVISGATGIGAYVVWNCTVETINGAPLTIRKRYSEFDHLRNNLVQAFPHVAASIPELPRKSVVSRFRPKFLESRGAGLAHFLK
ncbi:hypothetical protein MBLNU457_3083t2 [Dothideomycetes sp. NU457]